jgi:hypothetical protein
MPWPVAVGWSTCGLHDIAADDGSYVMQILKNIDRMDELAHEYERRCAELDLDAAEALINTPAGVAAADQVAQFFGL